MHGGDNGDKGQFHPMAKTYDEGVVVLVGKGEEMEVDDGMGFGMVAVVHSKRLYGDMQG